MKRKKQPAKKTPQPTAKPRGRALAGSEVATDPNAFALDGGWKTGVLRLQSDEAVGVFSPAAATVGGDVVAIELIDGTRVVGRWFRINRRTIALVHEYPAPSSARTIKRAEIKSMAPLVEVRYAVPHGPKCRNWWKTRQFGEMRRARPHGERLEREHRIHARLTANIFEPSTLTLATE